MKMTHAGSLAASFSGNCSDGRVRGPDYAGQELLIVFLRHLG